jgi:PAS domain S-box-containing protein/diguanylate cyclase (GGDEF)-like protein
MNLVVDNLAAVLASARDGIVVTDVSTPKNEIVYANAAFRAMIGFSETELNGLGTRFLLGKKTRPTAGHCFRRAISEKIPCLVTVSAARKDGTEIWLEISGAPVLESGLPTQLYIGVCRDVTQRTLAMEALLATDIAIEKPLGTDENQSIDPLTSLYNRSFFEEYAEREWSTMLRQHLPISIFMIGVKGCERLPATASGDPSDSRVLELMADNLRQQFRRGTDLVARFDQNTFVGIAAGMGWEEAEVMAQSTVLRINRALRESGLAHADMSCRIGVATAVPEAHHQIDEIISSAQQSLAQAMADATNDLPVAMSTMEFD